ncbi:Trp biosynthesis-associated membrane protein [Kineococcus sp. SYSU DK004]|uniref:Trp biosynthesis-associated membrane protein n=1 Tax=Kineococcus sp. SYSU DK004 TaxID=3383125 RepID=UPI003D7CC284
MTPARERGALLLLAAGGSLLALATGAPQWLAGAVETPTGLVPVGATGRAAAPLATAAALVGAAAAVAAAIGRRLARALAALVLVLAGAGVAVASLAVLAQPQDGLDAAARAASARTSAVAAGPVDVSPWPVVSAAGGAAAALAGAGVLVRGRRWTSAPTSRRYERDASAAPGTHPAPRAPEVAEDPAAAWDSLTRGDDPTGGGPAGSGSAGSTGPGGSGPSR